MVQDGCFDEQELIQGLRAQNPLMLQALIIQYSRELFYLIRLILAGVGTEEDAEECANDLFVVVWQEFEGYDPARASLRTWLTMRAKYLALDRRRRMQRRKLSTEPLVSYSEETLVPHEHPYPGPAEEQTLLAISSESSLDSLLEQQERHDELRRALEDLPELDRMLIYLRYFYFASMEELATRTGLSKDAVATRLWRVRRNLREVLQEQYNGTPVRTTERL
jgi:RNA polymerase sigma-70 factor (ECF subfamily)